MQKLVLIAALLASACAGQKLQPEIVSSADSTAYAQRYPEELEATRKLLADEKAEAQNLTEGLRDRTKTLKGNPDPQLLLAIVDRADAAGRGQAFADARAQDRAVRQFWEDERGPISGRVTAAVEQKATEAKCETTELGGSVPYALRDGIDRQLERRLRARNEAHLLIDRNKVALGAANVTLLQKLADDIALNSYLVHVALIEDAQRVERMVGERRQVESTLEDAIDEERKLQLAAQNPQERKLSDDRIAALTKSRDAVAGAAANAEGEIKETEAQVKAAQADYDAALEGLREQIRTRPKTS